MNEYSDSKALNPSSVYKRLRPLFKTLDDLVCLTIENELILETVLNSDKKGKIRKINFALKNLNQTIEFYKVNFIEPFAMTLRNLFALEQNLIKSFIDTVIKKNLSRISQNGVFESYKSKLEDLFKSFNYVVSQKSVESPSKP